MTYATTNLVADTAGGYSYVHCKQQYDYIAARLTAQGNWTLVDTVDYVPATYTYRTFVWKCASPGNGLAADFYVFFQCRFTTATGLWDTSSTSGSPQISIGELYNSGIKTASKLACTTSTTAVTINSDMTHPVQWVLTGARPTASGSVVFWCSSSSSSNSTTQTMCVSVTGGTLIVMSGSGVGSGAYVGVFDSVMNSTDDPMPIYVGVANGSSNQGSISTTATTLCYGSTTRHPKMTPSSLAQVFGVAYSPYHATSGGDTWGKGAYNAASQVAAGGSLGDSSNANWSAFVGNGPITSRVCIASAASGVTGSTRGGLRGFLRNIVACYAGVSNIGDTYLIDGKSYVSPGYPSNGQSAFLDTTA